MDSPNVSKYERIALPTVLIGLFVLFAFFDLSITQTLYDPSNVFGRAFEFIGEQPLQFMGVVSGALLFRLRDKSTPLRSILYGVLFVVVAVFFAGYAGGQFYAYASDLGAEKLYWLFLLVLALYMTLGFLLAYVIPVENKAKVFAYALSVVILYALIFLFMNVLKTIWQRPRWRYLVTVTDDPASLFKNVWELSPSWLFRSDYASFPSGHTMNAIGTLVIVPFICDICKVKKGFVFRLASYVWALLVALSRIIVGAHFATDVTFGFLIGFELYDLCFSLLYPRLEKTFGNRFSSDKTPETASN